VERHRWEGMCSRRLVSSLSRNALRIGVVTMLAIVVVPLVRPNLVPRPSLESRSATLDSRCYRYKPSERRFAKKMNKARDQSGRRRLSIDPEASKVARAHTRSMFRRRTLFHSPQEQLARRVTRWRVLGENIGVGNGVKELHKAFMASHFHRANILYSSFRHVGVGAARKKGRLWVTVVFESSNDPGTRLRMPRC